MHYQNLNVKTNQNIPVKYNKIYDITQHDYVTFRKESKNLIIP